MSVEFFFLSIGSFYSLFSVYAARNASSMQVKCINVVRCGFLFYALCLFYPQKINVRRNLGT